MKKIVFIKTIALAAVSLAAQAAVAQDIRVSRSGDTTVVVIDNPKKYLILPVEEDKGEARVLLDTGSPADTWMDVRLAQDRLLRAIRIGRRQQSRCQDSEHQS